MGGILAIRVFLACCMVCKLRCFKLRGSVTRGQQGMSKGLLLFQRRGTPLVGFLHSRTCLRTGLLQRFRHAIVDWFHIGAVCVYIGFGSMLLYAHNGAVELVILSKPY